MQSSGNSAVNRVELESQVLCTALRQSLYLNDREGIFTSVRELSYLFPDLLPIARTPKYNNSNCYEVLGINPQSNTSAVISTYLASARRFLKQGAKREALSDYSRILNAGFILRKPRLRLSHDMVIAKSCLQEDSAAAVTAELNIPENIMPVAKDIPPAEPDSKAVEAEEREQELEQLHKLNQEQEEEEMEAVQELETAIAPRPSMPYIQDFLDYPDDPLPSEPAAPASVAPEPIALEPSATTIPLPEVAAEASTFETTAAETEIPAVEPTATLEALAQATEVPVIPTIEEPAEDKADENGENGDSVHGEKLYEEVETIVYEEDNDAPLLVRLLMAVQFITPLEIKALKAQMHLAPSVPVEKLILNAGYVTPQEMSSLKLAESLLNQGQITMPQFQVAMYDERASGIRMAESLQVRGWLTVKVKNSMEEYEKEHS